jgi:GT2 family glycosyltransferase
MPDVPTCSIIIPAYNKISITRQCLNTVLTRPAHDVSSEIIVVDDASTDLTPQVLKAYGRRIRQVRHAENRGFATSCNDGAAAAVGELLVFLNNDTLPHPGWLDALVRYAQEHPRAAAIGARLLYPDDTIQHAGVVICRDKFPRHIYRGFASNHPAVTRSRRFQIVTAACVLIRRHIFEQIGGFDTAYINGYEDVDLCLRLGQMGHEVHYCADSVLVHMESASRVGRMDWAIHNTNLLRERWMDRMVPDDLETYVEDGLIELRYPEYDIYPVSLRVDPALAIMDEPHREQAADRLLMERSRQVWRITAQNVTLGLRIQELGDRLAAQAAGSNGCASSDGKPTLSDPRTIGEPRMVAEGTVHAPAGSDDGRLISVIMRVKDGAELLRETLPRVLSQRTGDRIEIIAIDAGSTDDTLDVLTGHSATVLAIDPPELSHGQACNLAANYARGDIFVFLSQSATPLDDEWLPSLVAALDADEGLAGVCSRIVPRPDADPIAYKDALRDLSGSTERSVREIGSGAAYEALSLEERRAFVNFHTVSAAIRPSIFIRIPFREILSGEDVLWAREVLEAGYRVQHEPGSRVYRSHNDSPFETLRRNVDDGRANREIVGRDLEPDGVLPLITEMVRDDWTYLEREAGLSGEELRRWQIESVLRRAALAVGQWIGANADRSTADLARHLSLIEVMKTNDAAEAFTPPTSAGSGSSPSG